MLACHKSSNDMEPPKRIDAHLDRSDDEDLGRDWLKIDRNAKNGGFREGMEAGQDQMLQAGFNAGFREALQMSLAGGQFQGLICAQLSYPARDVSEPTPGRGVQGKSASSHVCGQLQKLLSSNTELISHIPRLLQASLQASAWHQPAAAESVEQPSGPEKTSDLSTVYTDTAVTRLDLISAPRESEQCTAVDQVTGTSNTKGSEVAELSCQHVCSSQSHFWSQLQHFKLEAQAFGAVTSHD